MTRFFTHRAALCLLLLLSAYTRADFTHNFDNMRKAGTLVTIDATHVGTTVDEVVYTLYGSADVFWDYAHRSGGVGAKMSLNMLAKNDSARIAPAFKKLNKITLYHTSEATSNILSSAKLAVLLSRDGSDWATVTPTVTYSAGTIEVTAPSEDTYYIKIFNKTNTKVSIQRIDYEFGPCDCFQYVP